MRCFKDIWRGCGCWQGTMSARFLRHEGFLGAVGAFLKVHPMTPPNHAPTGAREPRKVWAMYAMLPASFTVALLPQGSCNKAFPSSALCC